MPILSFVLKEDLIWGVKSEAFSWPLVELIRQIVTVGLVKNCHARSFGEVLSE